MKNKNRFSELLDRYLCNNAEEHEREELMRLIREGNSDDELRSRIDFMLKLNDPKEDMGSVEAEEALRMILSAEHERSRSASLIPKWLAAAAALALLIMFTGWLVLRTETRPETIALEVDQTESAFFTGKQFVRLPDGSTVLLNDNSRLSYASSFGKKIRQVNLLGEGYFDVQHDPSRPFVVATGRIITTVLGTSFNVRAYPGQEEVEVTVTRGKVVVGDSVRAFGILTPDQQIAVNTTTNEIVQTNRKNVAARLWQSKYLILDNVSIGEAARTLAEKYGVQVDVAGDALAQCRISATFLDGEDLQQVLTVVTAVVKASFVFRNDGSVVIEGKGCR